MHEENPNEQNLDKKERVLLSDQHNTFLTKHKLRPNSKTY